MISSKIYLVRWLDSYGPGPNWREPDDDKWKPLICMSYGLVIEDKTTLTVIPHYAPDGHERAQECFCGEMTIPLCAVVSKTELKPEIPSGEAVELEDEKEAHQG